MKKVWTDFPRVTSLVNRARVAGLDGHAIVKRIASFDTVEDFQVWKNNLTETEKTVLGRVGRGYYRHLRDIAKEA